MPTNGQSMTEYNKAITRCNIMKLYNYSEQIHQRDIATACKLHFLANYNVGRVTDMAAKIAEAQQIVCSCFNPLIDVLSC